MGLKIKTPGANNLVRDLPDVGQREAASLGRAARRERQLPEGRGQSGQRQGPGQGRDRPRRDPRLRDDLLRRQPALLQAGEATLLREAADLPGKHGLYEKSPNATSPNAK